MPKSRNERLASALKALHDFLDFSEWLGRVPSAKGPLLQERRMAFWLIHQKQARRGAGTCVWFPEVEAQANERGFQNLFIWDTRKIRVFDSSVKRRRRSRVRVVEKCDELSASGRTQWLCTDGTGGHVEKSFCEIVHNGSDVYRSRSDFVDMVGRDVGRWTVLGYAGAVGKDDASWFCECECGIVRKVLDSQLKDRSVVSCGCAKSKKARVVEERVTIA